MCRKMFIEIVKLAFSNIVQSKFFFDLIRNFLCIFPYLYLILLIYVWQGTIASCSWKAQQKRTLQCAATQQRQHFFLCKKGPHWLNSSTLMLFFIPKSLISKMCIQIKNTQEKLYVDWKLYTMLDKLIYKLLSC